MANRVHSLPSRSRRRAQCCELHETIIHGIDCDCPAGLCRQRYHHTCNRDKTYQHEFLVVCSTYDPIRSMDESVLDAGGPAPVCTVATS